MRTAARTDGNQAELCRQLEQIGCSILYTFQLKNCFDLLVGYRGINYIFEVKDPKQPLAKRQLTSGELEFKNRWKGGPYYIVHSFDEALAILTAPQKVPKTTPLSTQPNESTQYLKDGLKHGHRAACSASGCPVFSQAQTTGPLL